MNNESTSENLIENNRGKLFSLYKEGQVDTSILNSTQVKVKNLEFKVPLDIAEISSPSTGNVNTKIVEIMKKSMAPARSINLIVNKRQKDNPLMDSIKNICWEFGDIEPDFIMGKSSCSLFLSLKYHDAKPMYIYERIKNLKNAFELRVLLILVDVQDSTRDLRELTKICISQNLTMVLAWSYEEAARYIESYKSFENKPPDLLMGEKPSMDGRSARDEELAAVISFLTSAAAVNKTDARSLIEEFGTIEAVMLADCAALQRIPGFGALKAKSLYDLFRRSIVRRANEDDLDQDAV